MTSTPDSIEGTIIIAVRWVKLGVEVFGAVAVIRTGLNFFLSMEMKGERTVALAATSEPTLETSAS